jgi:hypothetical protein
VRSGARTGEGKGGGCEDGDEDADIGVCTGTGVVEELGSAVVSDVTDGNGRAEPEAPGLIACKPKSAPVLEFGLEPV